MSYILDALKKSDQQRQRGLAPTLTTAQAVATAPKRPRLLLASVIAVILIITGMVIGWLRPWQHLQSASVPESSTTRSTTPALPLPATGPTPALPEMAVKPAPLMQESTSAPPSVVGSADTTAKRATPALADNEGFPSLPQARSVTPKESAISVPDQTVQTTATAVGQEKKVLALHELPASMQREIPNISISFHIYSGKPKDRRVMINGEMAGEGDLLAPGLSIEQITPDGVILDYKGYRFHRGFR